jgi:hypothetical protein
MAAYEEMLSATSTDYAPWYVIPADDKWFARLCAGAIVYFEFEKLGLEYPEVSEEQRKKLQEVKEGLLAEGKKKKNGAGSKS